MSTAQRILAGITLALAVLGVGIAVTSHPDVTFEGRPFSEWLRMLYSDSAHATERQQASDAIRRMGAAAVPPLERALGERPDSIRGKLRASAQRLGWVRAPVLPHEELVRRAAWAAFVVADSAGADTSSLVPVLRGQFLQAHLSGMELARALSRAGPPGIACLTNLILTGDARVRDQSGWALSFDEVTRRKPGTQQAVVRAAMTEKDPRIRANFALYLSMDGGNGDASQLVPLGVQFLSDTNANTRWMGARLLSGYVGMPEARKALEGALADPEAQVRATATSSLKTPR